MATEFQRLPTVNGDNNAWGGYLLKIIRDSIGNYSCYLHDDSGTLKVSAGQIGINDGTNEGVCVVEDTSITLSGTSGIWQKIEVSVSGTAVTFHATDIAGETEQSAVPSSFQTAYVDAKQGYYMISTRRAIGLAFVNSAGTLAAVITANNNTYGFHGYGTWSDYEPEEMRYRCDRAGLVREYMTEIGSWDMNADEDKVVPISLSLNQAVKCKQMSAVIYRDDQNRIENLNRSDSTGVIMGSVQFTGYISPTLPPTFPSSAAYFQLVRTTGGEFDGAGFDDTTINRGYVTAIFKEDT